MMCILAISKVSRFKLVSVAEQAGLNLTWSKISEDTFSRNVAQLFFSFFFFSNFCATATPAIMVRHHREQY